MSTRTLVRDTLVKILSNGKGRSDLVRVPEFQVSLRFLADGEVKQHSTYCVIITDEVAQPFTQRAFEFELTVKVVMYANDTSDPYGLLHRMIEDAHEAVMALQTHSSTKDAVRNVTPVSITVSDPTTANVAWAQGVMEWTLRHAR